MAWQTPKTDWAAGNVPSSADFNRIEENVRIVGQYDRAPGYGEASGENAKSIILNPAPASYYDGMCFAFKNLTQNTGAVTININGLGAKPVKKPNGNDIAAENLKTGSIYTIRYNGTNFILQGEGGEYGTAEAQHVLENYTIGTENGLVPGAMPDNGAVTITPSWSEEQTISKGYHNGNGKVKRAQVTAGDNVVYSDLTSVYVGTTYTKIKAAKVFMDGVYRVTFRLRTGLTEYAAYGRIYVNGIAVGIERSTNSGDFVAFTEDITLNRNDSAQLWIKSTAGQSAFADRFLVKTAEGYYVVADSL